MKLTVLGSGTVIPNGERNSSGYFVELPDAGLMLDCGAGTVHALARYGLPWERMTHLFVSHFHVDHAGELAALFYALRYGIKKDRNHPFTIVGPRGLDRVMDALKLAFGSRLFNTTFPLIVRMVDSGEQIELGADSFLSVIKTPHTPESLAVRIESRGKVLCYTGDTAFDDELARFFRGADVLISECSLREPREGVPHLSVNEVAQLASRARASKLIATHFYFDFDEAVLKSELNDSYAGEVIIASDGFSLEV